MGNTDRDPAPDPDLDPDPDPGFFISKIKEINLVKENLFIFRSLIALKTLIEDSWAQVKIIRPSTKWSIFLT